jgi:3(or 17)beta-hydroxysteroid dehydrogenase
MTFENKVVLITGGLSDIGKRMALFFADKGASVIISDIKKMNTDTILIDGKSDAFKYLHLDVTSEKDWFEAILKIENCYGKLNILINNAGILHSGDSIPDPENLSYDSWEKVQSVNLGGVFLGCKFSIPLLKNSYNSSIINIASRSGTVGGPLTAAYSASKAGVINYTKSVALYCANQGYSIRCNAINPGPILTKMWDGLLGNEEERKARIAEISSEIPLKRIGLPEDIAHAVLFLCSDAASYITGMELNLDGGISAGTACYDKKIEDMKKNTYVYK